jgi:hypothetical protein
MKAATLTPKQFVDLLTKGKPIDAGAIVEGDCKLEDLDTLTHLPGVSIQGSLEVTRCSTLATIDPELKVTKQASFNWLPEITEIPDTKSQVLSIWNCPKVSKIPKFDGKEFRIADAALREVTDIKAELGIRLHEMKLLVRVGNLDTAVLACSQCPELGIIDDVRITEELLLNVAPMIRDLPVIGEGNTLARLFLQETAVEVIPSNYFNPAVKRKDSCVHLENNQVLRFVPAMNVEELTIFDCPGVRKVEDGSTFNEMLDISAWVDCGKDVKLKGKLRVRNVDIPAQAFYDPEYITTQRILDETNLEVRRVYTERKGFGEFVKEAGGIVIDEVTANVYEAIKQARGADPIGMKGAKLWKLQQPGTRDEDIVVVELINSTPEPEGYHKTYFLRVPPTTATVIEGVAWTFGKSVDEYMPLIES